jgi:Spy/CpxP family protein refolding chaperone
MGIKIMRGLLMLLIFLSISALKAQTTIEKVKNGQYGTPQERAAELDQQMKEGLKLTDEQMPKIQDINLRYSVRTENEVAKTNMSSWSKYRKICAIQSDKDKELKRVLTAVQFKKYAKKRDELMWEGMKAMLF